MLQHSFAPLLPATRPLQRSSVWQRIHLDPLLLGLTLILIGMGLTILYSAAEQEHITMAKQTIRLAIACCIMLVFAQIPPNKYKTWTPSLFLASLFLLIAVLIIGKMGKGAQRWLSLGFFRFQPSEILKISVPMMVAWLFSYAALPPRLSQCFLGACIILCPALLIAKQPDLGTAILILVAGGSVFVFARIPWQIFAYLAGSFVLLIPILWQMLHTYQKQRILTLLNPERDPLGTGYHIIQSKIAIGSGGFIGKGWLLGTQSHLNFLPEHATDFIFAVAGEEFGFIGALAIVGVIFLIVWRALLIATTHNDPFSRLLASSLALLFFFSAFINIGMVCGILPVVGIPLPLVSYGGTSMVTTLATLGIIMSVHTHRKLI